MAESNDKYVLYARGVWSLDSWKPQSIPHLYACGTISEPEGIIEAQHWEKCGFLKVEKTINYRRGNKIAETNFSQTAYIIQENQIIKRYNKKPANKQILQDIEDFEKTAAVLYSLA